MWAHDKELTINTTKTEVMHITSPNITRVGQIKVVTHALECLHRQNSHKFKECSCQNTLRQVKVFKYLGVHIEENLSWSFHIDVLCKKLSICAMKMNNLKWFVPSSTMLQIYYGLVASLLNYGITAWGHGSNTQLNRVQNLQNKCIKAITWRTGLTEVEDICKSLKILNVKQLVNYTILSKYRNKIAIQEVQKHEYGTRSGKETRYLVPKTTNKYGERTLKVKIPKNFNELPEEIRETMSNTRFKKRLKSWMIENNT